MKLPNWINAGPSEPGVVRVIFTDHLTLSQPRGTDNVLKIITGTPGFLHLPAAPVMLLCIIEVILLWLILRSKEVQIVYRLFLVNCYLLHVPRLPSQPASSGRGWVIDFIWLELPRQYKAMTRNNLRIILISLLGSTANMHLPSLVIYHQEVCNHMLI